MINADLWRRLEKIGEEDTTTKAYLISLENTAKRFEFMFFPSSIEINASNKFSESYAMFGTKGFLRYNRSELVRIDISDLIFTVPRHNRSMIPVEKDLDSLRYPSKDQLEPTNLSFVFGKRSIQPLKLAEYSITESEHLNGVPTTLLVSLSFIASDSIKL